MTQGVNKFCRKKETLQVEGENHYGSQSIMLENMKKRKGSSLVTLSKMIIKVSLHQEEDTSETTDEIIVNINKPTTDVS
jgi:hypothetical protein